MNSIPNKYDLDFIETKHRIHAYCPLGEKTYTANITVQFKPGEKIPDYISLDEEIMSFNDKDLLIEDLICKVCEVMESINPVTCTVTVKVEDASHCPVTITKSI